MKIAIAGAGIGGLAAALCLHGKGCDVRIFELVDAIRPLGVGINVMPHDAGVLHRLGLGPALDAMASRTRCIEYRTRFGHLIQRSEEYTSELQSLMRISYAVFCLKKQTRKAKL